MLKTVTDKFVDSVERVTSKFAATKAPEKCPPLRDAGLESAKQAALAMSSKTSDGELLLWPDA